MRERVADTGVSRQDEKGLKNVKVVKPTSRYELNLFRSCIMASTPTNISRLTFLYSSSTRAFSDAAPALSRVLLHAARPQLPERAAQHGCPYCFSLLVPGVSCSAARERQRRRSSRPAARRRVVRMACAHCNQTTELPAPARPSARAAIAAAPEVAASAPAAAAAKSSSAARGKRSSAPPPQQAFRHAKRPRGAGGSSGAAPPPTGKAPASDTLFGFDFVAM